MQSDCDVCHWFGVMSKFSSAYFSFSYTLAIRNDLYPFVRSLVRLLADCWLNGSLRTSIRSSNRLAVHCILIRDRGYVHTLSLHQQSDEWICILINISLRHLLMYVHICLSESEAATWTPSETTASQTLHIFSVNF